MSAIASSNSRIAFLDYLRIFAFLSVLIGHKFTVYINEGIANEKLHITPKLLLELILPFVRYGGSGVIVFFLVSGYIISHVLLVEKTKSFLIRRAFRIYPLYFTAIFIQIIVEQSDIPPLTILIPRLLLIGDFFNTPYALMGVEWTLRVEIIFYLFMAILKSLNFWQDRKHLFITVFLIATLIMSQLPPLPNELLKGYFIIYSPFLFLGSAFWLCEQTWISVKLLIISSIIIFIHYFYLISLYQPNFLLSHFAILGFLVFTLAWIHRNKFQVTMTVLFLSDLTYSVYLLHNFMFDFFKNYVEKLSIITPISDCIALILLFTLCFLVHKAVERPANTFGRLISSKILLKLEK